MKFQRVRATPYCGGIKLVIDEPEKPLVISHDDAVLLSEYLADIVACAKIEKDNVSRDTAKPAHLFQNGRWQMPQKMAEDMAFIHPVQPIF